MSTRGERSEAARILGAKGGSSTSEKKRAASVLNGAKSRKPLRERFFSQAKVTGPSECWVWGGALGSDGKYGKIMVNRSVERAHRVAWVLENGPIPKGMWVLHRCDNPPCVNPAHLFLGTHADNMKDMSRKGRGTGRIVHPRAKVDAAIQMFRDGATKAEVNRAFGFGCSFMSRILNGTRRKVK